jgi:hypothetical protein
MRLLLIISLIVGIILQVYYFTALSDKVAINFGSGGQPNSWTSKEWNMGITITIYLINSLMFLSVPLMMKKIPLKYISFPKKEYWLTGERMKESIPVIDSWLSFFGLLTNIFIILVVHLVYEANLSDPVILNETQFFIAIVIYSLVLVIWIVMLFKKFNKTHSIADVGMRNTD